MWSVQPVHVSHCFPLPQFAWLCLITCLDLSSHHQSSVLKKAEIPQIHATALCRRREGVCKHVQPCANMCKHDHEGLAFVTLTLTDASMNKCGLWMTMSDVEMTNNHKQPISPSGPGVRAQAFRRGGQLRRPLLWHRTSHDGHSPHPSREPSEPLRAETLCSLLTTRLSALWLSRDSVDLKTSTLNSTIRPLTPFDALWLYGSLLCPRRPCLLRVPLPGRAPSEKNATQSPCQTGQTGQTHTLYTQGPRIRSSVRVNLDVDDL